MWDALPALYIQCLDTDATIGEVAAGGLTGRDLQHRFTTVTSNALALLNDALALVTLQSCPDLHWLHGNRSNIVRAGDIYGDFFIVFLFSYVRFSHNFSKMFIIISWNIVFENNFNKKTLCT